MTIDRGFVFIDPPQIKIKVTCPWCGGELKGGVKKLAAEIEIMPEPCPCLSERAKIIFVLGEGDKVIKKYYDDTSVKAMERIRHDAPKGTTAVIFEGVSLSKFLWSDV